MKLIKVEDGVAALEIILVIIILGIIGFTANFVWQKNKSKPAGSNSVNTTTAEKKPPANLVDLSAYIKESIPKKFSFVNVADPGGNGSAQLGYIVAGYDYVVGANNANTAVLFKAQVITGSQDEFQQFLPVGDEINKELVSAGFSLDPASNKIMHNDPLNRGQLYSNTESVCGVSVNTGTTRLDCVPKVNFTKVAETAKPLVDAYLKTQTDIVVKDMRISAPEIKDSKTSGYRFAQMGIGRVGGGGSSALFYEKNGTWKYFKSTQMTLACSDYQTNPDVKKAFTGEQCQDPATNTLSTVQ